VRSKIAAMRQVLWAVVFLACCFDTPPQVRAQIACTTVCTCFANAGQIDACVDDCVSDGELGTVPDDCFECIQLHANQCTTLEDDCEQFCVQAPPPEDFPDGGMR
jgi:hypothetical protein